MKDSDFEIPIGGSLGLLALGHIGLQLWRNKRKDYELETGKKFVSTYEIKINKTNKNKKSNVNNKNKT